MEDKNNLHCFSLANAIFSSYPSDTKFNSVNTFHPLFKHSVIILLCDSGDVHTNAASIPSSLASSIELKQLIRNCSFASFLRSSLPSTPKISNVEYISRIKRIRLFPIEPNPITKIFIYLFLC